MALSQSDRIAISKKIVVIPSANEESADSKAILQGQLAQYQANDTAHKNLMDDKTILINPYQTEAGRYDGQLRTVIVEQDMINAADKVDGNYFYLNKPTVPTPSVPSGVWKNLSPFANGYGIGKNYTEGYGSTQKEQDLIDTIEGLLTSINAVSEIIRTTGESCGSSGTCSLPLYTDEAACLAATPTPGIWTPGPDIISTNAAIHTLHDNLVTAVQAWQSFYLATKAIINAIVDPNATRGNFNVSAMADIDAVNTDVNAWLALQDYDTNHGQTTCIGFNAYNPMLLNQTKLRNDGLTILTTAIVDRQLNIADRLGSLTSSTYLGTVVQTADGSITTSTGLYGQRFGVIDLRLNLTIGSLNQLKSIQRGAATLDQMVASNNAALNIYASIMTASIFLAPSVGSNKIHVKDTAGFTVGDQVYVMADKQEEIVTFITAITGFLVELTDVVPEKYRETEFARLYKEL